MARALFLSLPLHGHVNPSLPLVRELVDRGDAVTYYAAEAFAGRIEQTGAQYRPYRNAFLADIKNLPERMDELAWLLDAHDRRGARRRTGRLPPRRARLCHLRCGRALGNGVSPSCSACRSSPPWPPSPSTAT